MFSRSCQWMLLTLLLSPSLAKLYTSPSLLTKKTYDYVVVGAGPAGALVAATLTKDPRITVLLVEAGISDAGIINMEIPLLAPVLTPGTPYDWNYTTTTQIGLLNRSIPYPRGKVLGGSTSVNYLVYGRGSSDDYNRYAEVTGDRGWNWDNMFQYARAHEKLVPPVDHHNTTGQYVPSLHGNTGPVQVSLYGYPTPLENRVIATTQELPELFPFTRDTIGGDVVGFGYSFASIGNGTRSSSSTAYLAPASDRPNLDIVINTQATKLLVTGKVNDLPSFHALQLQENASSPVYTVRAKSEIVLSAGAFGTPVLLQLSGIGDPQVLSPLGIPVVINNPSVGQNMSDHVLVPNPFFVTNNDTYDNIFRTPSLFEQNLEAWIANKSTPFSADVCNTVGWLRLPTNDPIFRITPDPSAGLNSAHFEYIISNFYVNPTVPIIPPTGNYMSLTTNLITPSSRGSINITSTNPFVNPTINPNWLTTDFDIHVLIYGLKLSMTFVNATPWHGYVIGPASALANATSDADFEDYIRNNAGTVFHPTGTASMSPIGARWGVVDPDLKVKGAEGLRIVDASIMPYVPSGHTAAPVYIIAGRGAALIQQARRD